MKVDHRKIRKRNCSWVITDGEGTNLDVVEHTGYTAYETNEVIVAIVNRNNDGPAEPNSRSKRSKFSLKRKNKECETANLNGDNKVAMERLEVCESLEEGGNASLKSNDKKEDNYNEDETCESSDSGIIENSEICDNEDPNCQTDLDAEKCNILPVNLAVENSNDLPERLENSVNVRPVSSHVNFFKLENIDKYLLHLSCHTSFTFWGKLRLTLLAGEIETFGFTLNNENDNRTIDMYCPRRCMQISITSRLPSSVLDSSEMESILKSKANISDDDLNKLLGVFQPDDTLLLAEKLVVECSPMLGHYCDDVDIFFEKQVLQEGLSIEKDLDCLFNSATTLDRKAFTEGCKWKDIETKKCTVLCGGKGVGKSTLLKYLINVCISNNKSALCIDLDPGQTEFTPPGCVCAVLIQKPLLGPNFTHILKPEKMAFLGSVNVGLDPVKYMKSVSHIIQSCKENAALSGIPWFVNTMGFNKGIGLALMINIIKLLQPDVLVQINSSDKSRNYAIDLTPSATESFSVITFLSSEKINLNYDFIKTNSCAKLKGIGFQSGFKPAELRDLMMLAYFSPLVSFPYYSLNAAQPHWIHLSEIYLAVNDAIPPEYILTAFNGSLVGLCNLEGISCRERLVTEDSEAGFCKIAIKPEIAPCYGLGIVRGIDYEEKKVYILTPLSESELQKVNCLNMGDMNPPPSVFLKQRFVDGPAAYTDISGTRSMQHLKRIFKYIPHLNANEIV